MLVLLLKVVENRNKPSNFLPHSKATRLNIARPLQANLQSQLGDITKLLPFH
jgi:hypothetical protein